MKRNRTKDFLADFHNGMLPEELMRKYNLSEERLGKILRMLRRSDLLALRRFWEQDKLTDSQFMRAFAEVEDDLNSGE